MQRSVMFYVICIASQAVIDIRYSTFERETGHQKSSHDSSLLSMRTKKTGRDLPFLPTVPSADRISCRNVKCR